ncbi:MAG: hypothetical protein KDI64_10250 [Candidatus Accumulibacter sp.]|nr:hypothetical protein [Accumulibacter sp.]
MADVDDSVGAERGGDGVALQPTRRGWFELCIDAADPGCSFTVGHFGQRAAAEDDDLAAGGRQARSDLHVLHRLLWGLGTGAGGDRRRREHGQGCHRFVGVIQFLALTAGEVEVFETLFKIAAKEFGG